MSVAFAPNSNRPRSRLYLDIFDRMHLFLVWRLCRRSICNKRSQISLLHNHSYHWTLPIIFFLILDPYRFHIFSSPFVPITLRNNYIFFFRYLFYELKLSKPLTFIPEIVGQYHHHHVAPSARISLTLSSHPSLSSIVSGGSSGLHPVLAQSCCIYLLAGRPSFEKGSTGVRHLWVRLFFSSSASHVWFV